MIKDIPPFPVGLPTAPIARISYAKLLNHDTTESQKVVEACKLHGFFYLDMRDDADGQAFLERTESIMELATEFFSLPLRDKRRYAMVKGKSVAGYKEAGSIKKTDQAKRPDTTEFLNVFKDHMHGISESRHYPDILERGKPSVRAFNKMAHACGMTVLDTLARGLSMPSTDFTSLHKFYSGSEDQLRMTRTMPLDGDAAKSGIGLASHTDFGSVTILFNWLGGLQIQSRDPDRIGQWDYVQPLPGHAIINLGDAMVVFTNGHLKSAKHRVVPAPGEQGKTVRYSLVYFVRPNDHVLLKPIEHFKMIGPQVLVGGKLQVEQDKVYNAAEWMIKRASQMGAWDDQDAKEGDKDTPLRSRL